MSWPKKQQRQLSSPNNKCPAHVRNERSQARQGNYSQYFLFRKEGLNTGGIFHYGLYVLLRK